MCGPLGHLYEMAQEISPGVEDIDKGDSSDSDNYGCQFKSCYYGGSEALDGISIYCCTKCEGLDICHECIDKGRHAKHKDYLVKGQDWSVK